MESSEPTYLQSVRLLVCGVDVSGKRREQSVTAYDLDYSGARLEGVTHAIAPGTKIDLHYKDVVVPARVVWLVTLQAHGACRAGIRLLDPKRCPWKNALPDPDGMVRFPQRRRSDRYRISIGIQMQCDDYRWTMQASTSDIGIGGCYIETEAPLEVGARVQALLRLGIRNISTEAIVRATYPGIGMGLEFLDLSWEQSEQLYKFLESKRQRSM